MSEASGNTGMAEQRHLGMLGATGIGIYLPLLFVVVAGGMPTGQSIQEAAATDPEGVIAMAAERFLGPFGYWLVIVAAILSMLSALRANLFAASRIGRVLSLTVAVAPSEWQPNEDASPADKAERVLRELLRASTRPGIRTETLVTRRHQPARVIRTAVLGAVRNTHDVVDVSIQVRNQYPLGCGLWSR